MKRVIESLTILGCVAALVLYITLQSAAELPRSTRISPPVDIKTVCTPIADGATAYLLGADAIAPLGGDPTTVTGTVVEGDQSAPLVVTGSRRIIGGMLSSTSSNSGFSACSPPRSNGYFTLNQASDTSLIVVNSDSTETLVDLSLYGPDGQIRSVGSRGIAVGAGASREVALSVLVEGTQGPVGVAWKATKGRAVVIAVSSRKAAAVTSGETSQQLLLGPLGRGTQSASVALTNTSPRRVEASVEILGELGSFAPVDGDSLSIAPTSSISLDIADALAQGQGFVRITSSSPISAGLSSGSPTATILQGPAVSGTELAAVGPAGGELLIANPSQTPVSVEVTGTQHEIPGGATVGIDLPTQHGLVSLSSPTPVVAGVIHGEGARRIVVPLTDAGPVGAQPLDAELDPLLR